MDHRHAEMLLGVWRRQARRRKRMSDVVPLLIGIAFWLVLLGVVLFGMMLLSQA